MSENEVLKTARVVLLLLATTSGCGADPGQTAASDVDDPGVIPETGVSPLAAGPPAPLPYCPPWFACPSGSGLVSGYTPLGLAVSTGYVYWSATTSQLVGQVLRVPLQGGAVTTLYSDPQNPAPGAVVADPQDNVYWTTRKNGQYALWFWSPNDVATQLTAGMAGQAAVQALALPPNQSKKVYFALTDLALESVTYFSPLWISWTGWIVSQVAPAVSGSTFYYPQNVTVDAVNAYFVTDATSPAVYQVALSGGSPIQIGAASAHSPIATDGSNVYVVSGVSIKSIPVGGGAPVKFASDAGAPTTFAVDGGNLYWTCSSCGTVSKKAFSGGSVTNVAWNQANPTFVALGPTNAYWGVTNGIRYAAK